MGESENNCLAKFYRLSKAGKCELEMETEAQILSRFQREAESSESSFDPLELDRFSQLQQLSRALAESV